MNRLLFWSLTASLAGFLFGFDTIVISGAEQEIQRLWDLSDQMHGLAVSMALWGTVLGSLFGAWPADRFGRKPTLLSVGVLYFVSAVWSALATDVSSLMIARLVGGLGVGVSTVVAPLYIAEITPPERRGRLAGLFQLNIVLGILMALFSNFLLGDVNENAWRWMLGVETVPALLYTLLCLTIPESPRWLISRRGDSAEAIRILALADDSVSDNDVEKRAADIESASRETSRMRYSISPGVVFGHVGVLVSTAEPMAMATRQHAQATVLGVGLAHRHPAGHERLRLAGQIVHVLVKRHALAAHRRVAGRLLLHVHGLDDYGRPAEKPRHVSGDIGMPRKTTPLIVLDVMPQITPPSVGFRCRLVGYESVDLVVGEQTKHDEIPVALVLRDLFVGERTAGQRMHRFQIADSIFHRQASTSGKLRESCAAQRRALGTRDAF